MSDKEELRITVSWRDIDVPITLSVTKKQATTLREGTRVAAAIRDAVIAIAREGADEEAG